MLETFINEEHKVNEYYTSWVSVCTSKRRTSSRIGKRLIKRKSKLKLHSVLVHSDQSVDVGMVYSTEVTIGPVDVRQYGLHTWFVSTWLGKMTKFSDSSYLDRQVCRSPQNFLKQKYTLCPFSHSVSNNYLNVYWSWPDRRKLQSHKN